MNDELLHKERHKMLNTYLDELVADFITNSGKLPSETTIIELMDWSNKQKDNPDHKYKPE